MFFQPAFFEDLAKAVKKTYPDFDGKEFLGRVLDEGFEERALKERMRHTTLSMEGLLPQDYRQSLKILSATLIPLQDYSFEKTIYPDYVEVNGLDDWDASLPALEEFTQHMSAEFAVRPFIAQDQVRMMGQMLTWAKHKQATVRRLASEGCRPRLPWGMALKELKADPSPILPILEKLKMDESEDVRRSVANNLNDISKDNPSVVIKVLSGWQKEGGKEMEQLTSHALRTLVKAGNKEALELLGYPSDPSIEVKNFKLEPASIQMGETVEFSFDVVSTGESEQNLMIDYALHLVRQKGKTSTKVFKLSKQALASNESVSLSKKQRFKPITTRRYYSGEHAIEIQINGKSFGRKSFMLEVE
ncbi:MAG: DNA alkylation repair protein [Chloroflexi bacterium]|nr:MAG: DNA alkylation repair protein [Chloroflexota bacterium]MBL1196768.1 DNA alkylation repair protein [Chloroflexota bacterium]